MPALRTRPQSRPTKLQSVCAQLTHLAHQLGPAGKFPTVLQLRDTLGVSVATLNSALGELEAQRLISRKHGVGIYVSSQLHHRAISLICDPSFFCVAGASPFWGMLVEQARGRAQEKQEELSFHFTMSPRDNGAPLHDGLLNEIRLGRVDGVLAVGVTQEVADCLLIHRVPLVAFAGPARWVVGLDGAENVRLGTRELIRQGCRRIGLWSPVAPFRHSDGRAAWPPESVIAFQKILSEHGLAYDATLVKQNLHLIPPGGGYTTETHQEQGYRTALEVFGPSHPERPDGLVITDDMMTNGALGALRNRGVRIGRDVKIASHANVGSTVLLGSENDLTLIEVDPAEIVRAMFDTLETLMDGKIPQKEVIHIKPHVRRGSGAQEHETFTQK